MTAHQLDVDRIEGFRVLEFDLPSALLDQVVGMFDRLAPAQLTIDLVSEIPNAQGVYQLFHHDKLVYVGKTDSDAGLGGRLLRHARTIQSRHNLDVEDMGFKAVQVLVFSAMDLETALIRHYRRLKTPPIWNGSGFGNADPGRNRDTTALREDGFDANYPINIDMPLSDYWAEDASALKVVRMLASQVPYTIRHERSDVAMAELSTTTGVAVPSQLSVRTGMTALCAALSPGWQATRLSGRVIFYREHVDAYPGGEIIARS